LQKKKDIDLFASGEDFGLQKSKMKGFMNRNSKNMQYFLRFLGKNFDFCMNSVDMIHFACYNRIKLSIPHHYERTEQNHA